MSAAGREIPHLFQRWDRVAARIRRNKRLALFLDFDGTLSPIAPVPDAARLVRGARRVLQKLAGLRDVTLMVISGRRRADLQRRVRIRRIKYLGLYGWERNRSARLPAEDRVHLASALARLADDLQAFAGVWIEPKGSSFSIHLLGTTAKTQCRVRCIVGDALKPLGNSVRVMNNLRDIEVVPVRIGDKGAAVRELLTENSLQHALPVYFGDDLSDEPAFAAARRGISVLVGRRRPTHAQFFLRGPEEVPVALEKLQSLLE